MVRDSEKRVEQFALERLRDSDVFHREQHADHPLIALDFADREGQMARAQSRMAVLFREQRRSAAPTGEELIEFLRGDGNVVGVHPPNSSRLGSYRHVVIKSIDQAAQARFATQLIVE